MGIVQYAVLSDCHYPHEGKSYYKALDIMKTWPDLKHIYLNGDILEVESVSSHPKTPGAQRSLLAEIDYAVQKFRQLDRMFPEVPVTFTEGNHCYRYLRYLRDVCPELWGITSMPKLLAFDELGWKFVPYGPTQWQKVGKTSDLYCRHEPLQTGANHAKGTAEKSVVSIIYGHVHQRAEYTCKKHGPKPYHVTAYSPGWLGDISKECFDYRGGKDNWTEGFARVDCDEKTGEYEVRLIRV